VIIKQRGIEITQVPGVELIQVVASDADEFGHHVNIKHSSMDRSLNYGLRELGEYIEALQAALGHGYLMAGASWPSLHLIPEHVTVVYDRAGDRWDRPSDGWASGTAGLRWAPFATEDAEQKP
jgi:hypothetical protein